ncbi:MULTISPECIES: hypothetical protein [Vibrio]|uniref:hypothetical protein n=1 Tax=Vibrio TaxID=662 RepID=UPI00056E2A7A|nr:hypothetical protein [Vibrio pacinii]
MKKRIYTSLGFVALLCSGIGAWSYADNPAFPPIDNRTEQAKQQPSRFFVKYHSGAEQQTRELLRLHQLEVVETLEKQQVLVVSGREEQINKLSQSELIDYVEPEPIRSFYAQ